MHTILAKLVSIIIAPIVLIGGLFSPNLPVVSNPQTDSNTPTVGATLPQATGVFETSLATPITSTATSMTLTANAIRGGGAVSGYSCFTVDEGSAQAEVICGTVSGTTVSSLTRGVSYSDGVTSVSGNKFAHRRGANVKITDFPIVQILKAQNNGDATFANPLKYESGIAPLAADDLTDKEYVDGVAIAGAPDASTTVKGIGKTSVAPVSSTNPIFVGDNDGRVPTQSENDALVGTSGTPSTSNKYVTNDDTTGTGSVVRNSVVSGIVASITKFGGTGADGALNVTSGTTTIDLAGANVVVKNYTSINVSAGATLDFSNPASDGTIIIFKSQGTVTFAGTVDIRNLGSAGGAGGSVGNPGSAGSVPFGNVFSNTSALAGANTPTGSGTEVVSTTTLSAVTRNQNTLYSKFIALTVGGGGGGGYGGGTSATGGAGGRGAGSMYVESLGVLSITGTIQATGTTGSNAVAGTSDSGGGGGGGGAGGQFIVLYNSTVTNSGTYNFSGGNGGNGSAAGGGSGGNGASGGQGGGNAYPGGAGGRTYASNGNTGNNGATGGNSGGTGGTGGAAATASGGSGGGGGAGGFYLVVANTELN